jgi:hypothetical protein
MPCKYFYSILPYSDHLQLAEDYATVEYLIEKYLHENSLILVTETKMNNLSIKFYDELSLISM